MHPVFLSSSLGDAKGNRRRRGAQLVFVVGHVPGHRLNFELAYLVPRGRIVPLPAQFKEARANGESFGDFCPRLGAEALRGLLSEDARRPARLKRTMDLKRTTRL